MKLKKLIIIILLVVIFTAQFSFIQINNSVYAIDTENTTTQNLNETKYHYAQLTEEGKKIYNGIYEMYIQGILKTGTQDYDIAKDNKYFTQEQLESYSKGNAKITSDMNAARYAFYADHPEVFYVNFQCLSLRITQDKEGMYHAYIGSGRYKDYYIEGFTNQSEVETAIEEFNNRVNEIAEGANALKQEEGKNLQAEKIKYVHNEIINNTSYRVESDCTPGNESYIGTPYGALVKRQAVCEGYARAFKTVLDKVGINCILVQGVHKYEDSAAVPHMWTYVEMEKEVNARARSTEKVWYAVDITLDDPFLRVHVGDEAAEEMEPGEDIQEGFENTRYCLVGTETMNKEHTPVETVEAAGNYVFKYPELYSEDYGVSATVNINGLLVKYKQDGTQTEEYKAGDFYISYNGKGYQEASKEGKYILTKSYYYKPGDDEWQVSPWAYLLPDVYAGGFKDYDDHIYMSVPNSEYVEFAVTTLAPGDYQNDPKYLAYQGNESDFVAKSEKLYNPSGTYKGKPYIKTQTPPATQTIAVGSTYKAEVTYTDDLVFAEGATEAGYRIESTGPTGAEETKITNFAFNGKNKITFDIKFSQMFADDDASYRIYVTGLVGKNSGKEPLEITFGALNQIACSFRMNKAKNWEVYARPSLIENQDLSMNGWQTSDGKPVADELKSRIALVTTKTTTAETNAMNDLMENELGEQQIVKSETYNISLNVCKKYVVKTGHRLRLSLGFPEGYGPEDAGVTFKAYHFKRNEAGEVTGVEEIPCVVTQYGLIVTCDSFSPFAVAVVENDGTQSTNKSVIVSASKNGQINGANREEGNIVTLAEGQSVTLDIVPNEGYEIESLTVGGVLKEVTNKDNMQLVVNYEDVTNQNNIVEANFVAKTVVAREVEREETVVIPTAIPAQITMPETHKVIKNNTLIIEPTVKSEGINNYQWYKNGEALNGQTNKTLRIENVTENDNGQYTLKVATTVETQTVEATSTACEVTVVGASFDTTITKITEGEINPGKEFEVSVNINNFENINKGLLSLTAQLEYDSNILDIVKTEDNKFATGKNGWDLDAFNEANFKFITDNDKMVTEGGEVFTLKFKVKDSIETAQNTVIKIKGITASGGDGVIDSNDAQLPVNIEIKQKAEGITSDKYKITDEFISRIAPNTTVNVFKQNVETEQDMVFKNKDGEVLGEDDILATGMTLDVGSLHFSIVVTGDTDGDSKVTANDLAQIKLHIIEIKTLEGLAIEAADIDGDGKITINDAAQIKLVLINLLTIE